MLQQKYIFIHMQRPYLPRHPLSPQAVQFADAFTDESPVIGRILTCCEVCNLTFQTSLSDR